MLVVVFSLAYVPVAKYVLSFLFLVEFKLIVQLPLSLFQFLSELIYLLHNLFSSFSDGEDVFVSLSDGAGHILPLFKQFMSFIMLLLELLCSFVQLNL